MTDRTESPDEALARNMHRIRTEGLDAATDAALVLLRDPKAPAQAKSATINAIYRASGLFGRSDEESDLEPHEMTPAQLELAIRRAQAQADALERDKEPGVFD